MDGRVICVVGGRGLVYDAIGLMMMMVMMTMMLLVLVFCPIGGHCRYQSGWFHQDYGSTVADGQRRRCDHRRVVVNHCASTTQHLTCRTIQMFRLVFTFYKKKLITLMKIINGLKRKYSTVYLITGYGGHFVIVRLS